MDSSATSTLSTVDEFSYEGLACGNLAAMVSQLSPWLGIAHQLHLSHCVDLCLRCSADHALLSPLMVALIVTAMLLC